MISWTMFWILGGIGILLLLSILWQDILMGMLLFSGTRLFGFTIFHSDKKDSDVVDAMIFCNSHVYADAVIKLGDGRKKKEVKGPEVEVSKGE